MIILDTHALIWWTSTPELLSAAANKAIASSKALGVSAISFWEIALLIRKGRLALGMAVSEWVEQTLAIPRLRALPVTAQIALKADALEMHADPADRFIVATAIDSSSRLVSKDGLLQGVRQVKVVW